MDELPTERIGSYRLDRLLGQGGMARVYRAVSEDGDVVALKWLHRASPAVLAGFAEEVRVLERLDHPGIVRYRAHGVERGLPWLAMEYIEGQDLRVYAGKLRLRPPREREERARGIARALCGALAYVHAQGLVHRDVKPANVLLEGRGRVVLTDFGVAAARDEQPLTAVGWLVGTAAYAAPEQIAGLEVDARADQYGLGCTLYFLLTGRRPFEDADSAALLRAHLERAPRPPSELDPTIAPDLEAFVLRLLAKDPAARFADMREAEATLGAAAPMGLPLAGRQPVIDALAAALDRVAAGEGVAVQLVGHRGSGRSWFQALAREAADRRGLACVATDEAGALAAALGRVDAGEPLLVVTTAPVTSAEAIALPPLTMAELRRSVYAQAPATPRLAQVAERLHRETGGNAALLLALLARYGDGEQVRLPDGPLDVDAVRWTDGFDLDEEAVAGALAVLEAPAPVDVLQAVAQVPPEAALAALAERGVATCAGERWMLAAEALRGPLRASLPDPETLFARAAPYTGAAASAAPDPLLDEVARLQAAGARAAARAALEQGLAGADTGAVRGGRLLALGALLWADGDATGARRVYEDALVEPLDATARRLAMLGAGAAALQTGALDLALDRCADAITDAELAGDTAMAAAACLHLAEARAVSGRLAEAVRLARKALALAEGLRARALECAAARTLGMVLLDAGLPAEAARHLADASALARAADLASERLAAQVLRARASLEEHPDSRSGAAAALDRVLPQLAAIPADPGGYRLLARCVWAHAAAVLGDGRMYRRALAEADLDDAAGRVSVRLRAQVLLARAALAAGEPEEAGVRAQIAAADADARGFRLLAWEAERIAARASGAALPEAGDMSAGLPDAARVALSRR